jgi:hypothetical protein
MNMDGVTGEKRKRGPEDDLFSGTPQAPSTSRDLDYHVLEVDVCATLSLSSYHVCSLYDFNERRFLDENQIVSARVLIRYSRCYANKLPYQSKAREDAAD